MYSCFHAPFHSSLKISSLCENKNFANKNCLTFSNTCVKGTQTEYNDTRIYCRFSERVEFDDHYLVAWRLVFVLRGLFF